MSFNFNSNVTSTPKQPSFSDVPEGGFFQTSFGTVYVRVGDQVVKLGNPKVSGHNHVAVKDASSFEGRTDITLLGDLTIQGV